MYDGGLYVSGGMHVTGKNVICSYSCYTFLHHTLTPNSVFLVHGCNIYSPIILLSYVICFPVGFADLSCIVQYGTNYI